MSVIALLGPQFREPNLAPVLAELDLAGPLVSVTAGWQEREGEIDELAAHLGREVTDLGLYARTEHVFAEDRQPPRELIVRGRIASAACRTCTACSSNTRAAPCKTSGSRCAEPSIVRAARRSALGVMRRLDREHLLAIERVHQDFARRVVLTERKPLPRTGRRSHV